MTPPLLQLQSVTKHYTADSGEVPVLREVSLELRAGESIAIVGPSGSGKSTLLNLIGALDRPSVGRVLLNGRDLSTLSDDGLATIRAREIGFIFQLHHLLPQLSVLENVLVPTLAVTDRAARASEKTHERARRLLERIGLGARLAHRPGQLSGGERQRVAVVRALINEPRLVLADEPTGSLDQAAAEAMGTLLVELNREEGVALIVVTHALALAARMGRVLELRDGALAEAAR